MLSRRSVGENLSEKTSSHASRQESEVFVQMWACLGLSQPFELYQSEFREVLLRQGHTWD